MSLIKKLIDDVQDEQFITDDCYDDYLLMKKEHDQKQEMELINQHEATLSNRTLAASRPEFFIKKTDDLPF